MKLIIIASFFLAGCMADIEVWDIVQAENLCKDHGGIHHMHIDSGNSIITYCMDSTRKQLGEAK
jgi:hypothetical protein